MAELGVTPRQYGSSVLAQDHYAILPPVMLLGEGVNLGGKLNSEPHFRELDWGCMLNHVLILSHDLLEVR